MFVVLSIAFVVFFLLRESYLFFTPFLRVEPWEVYLLLDRLLFAGLYLGLGGLLLRRSFRKLVYFRKRGKRWQDSFRGMFVGLLLFVGLQGYLALLPEDGSLGGFQQELSTSLQTSVLPILVVGVVTPVLEEVFYRGFLQEFLTENLCPPALFLVLSAAFFALAHLTGKLPVLPFLFVVGLSLGILYWRSGLVPAILAHALYNSAILVASSS